MLLRECLDKFHVDCPILGRTGAGKGRLSKEPTALESEESPRHQ